MSSNALEADHRRTAGLGLFPQHLTRSEAYNR